MMNGVRDYDKIAQEMCSRHSVISGSPHEFRGCRRPSAVSLDFEIHLGFLILRCLEHISCAMLS